MRSVTRTLLALATLSWISPVEASSVGASLYVPTPVRAATVKQASCDSPGCAPGAPCAGGARIGFAGVDGATPAPCTAEGGCYPNRSTWGYTQTRWRQWPGAVYNQDQQQPTPGDEDSLLPAFDPPAPEDEDQQAPASISEEEEAASAAEEEPNDGPAVEITLPPFEEGPIDAPRPAPAPIRRDGPPALPFGFRSGGPDGARQASMPARSRWREPPLEAETPSLPAADPSELSPVRTLPPVKAASRDDAPPPLPGGFTGTPRPGLRRLPSVEGRMDSAVTPVSAELPIRARR